MKILDILTKKRIIGNTGEEAAVRLLKKKGYKILERNYVALGHEIDIIAQNKEYVIFVEVKTRTIGHENPKEPRPASAVTPKKQRSIIKTASFYFAYSQKNRHARFDVIEVYLADSGEVAKILHLENTFNKNTAYEK